MARVCSPPLKLEKGRCSTCGERWTLPRENVGAGPKAVNMADVNHDGILDLIVANYDGNSVTVLFGKGGGVFDSVTAASYPVGAGPCSIYVTNFNADGILDILTANELDGTLTILPG